MCRGPRRSGRESQADAGPDSCGKRTTSEDRPYADGFNQEELDAGVWSRGYAGRLSPALDRNLDLSHLPIPLLHHGRNLQVLPL